MSIGKIPEDLLHGSMNAGDPHNSGLNGEIVDREKIDGTPFYIEDLGQGYYLRMGKHRFTIETFKTKEEILEYINYNMYDLLLKMIIAIMADRDEINQLSNQ